MKNLWADTCAEPLHAPSLATDLNVDLVIIGGGFTGCSAALEAAGQGARVALLEAQTIGHGGSGRNVGLVNAGLWLPPDQVMAQLGQAEGIHLNTVLADGPNQVFDLIETHDIQCEPVRHGTLHCAHAPRGMRDLQDRYEQQAVRKAPVALLDMKSAQQAIGSKRFHGALRDFRAGTVQPLAYARGLARAATQAGAQVFEHSPVRAVQSKGHEWHIRTPDGTVRAGSLLVATNAYHQDFSGLQAAALTPVHYFQLATAPLPTSVGAQILPNREGCWDTGLVMTSFRMDQSGRFILGAMGLPDRLGLHRNWAERALVRLFPQLAGHAFDHFWSGRIGMTQDHIPKIQRHGSNGYSVFGYSGRGISPGTVFGRSCARALLNGTEADLPIKPVAQHAERFSKTKGVYYELGARLVHTVRYR